jgi:Family of unknown function (DUF5681)
MSSEKPPQKSVNNLAHEPAESVGPGRPPRHTRFKPGQSGNPNGRPKGSKNFVTTLQQQLRKNVTITIDGKPKRVTVQEVIARPLATDSMKGATRPMELLIRLTSTKSDDGAGKDVAGETVLPDKEALRRIHKRIGKLVGGEE